MATSGCKIRMEGLGRLRRWSIMGLGRVAGRRPVIPLPVEHLEVVERHTEERDEVVVLLEGMVVLTLIDGGA